MKIKKNIDFLSHKKTYWLISLCVLVIGILFNIINGAELDIKFTGGAMFKYSYCDNPEVLVANGSISATDAGASYTVSLDKAQEAVSAALGREVACESNTRFNIDADDTDNKMLVIALSGNEAVDESADTLIKEALAQVSPELTFTLRSSSSVDPTMGREFFLKCMIAVALAALFMIIYVAFRFKKIGGWTAGVSGIIAILHDCAVVYFVFIICRYPIDDNFIAVILAVIGYSLNSTIVIFDRIRENRRLFGVKATLAEVTNRSMNETLTRTINTNLCVFLSMATIALVSIIYGLDSIKTFAVPMMFGTVSGCYSSLLISNTIWVTWQEKILDRKLAAGKKGKKK